MTRFADTIKPWDTFDPAAGSGVVLLGLPDDTGVGLNNGFRGAAEGPAAFRDALARYGSAESHEWPRVFDAGDVEISSDLQETHDRVSDRAAEIAAKGCIPVAVGGGHDLTFAFVRGVQRSVAIHSGVYFDAHLDVREEIGSGMPFRRLIEDCGIRELVVHGLDPNANSKTHLEYFKSRNGRAASADLSEAWPIGDKFVSFDLDVIDMAHAPGVSARRPFGWDSREAALWVARAGVDRSVRCFDIMELCPPRDESGRTARLAAGLFVEFCRAFSERNGR